jgi:four helix bundle protein
MRAQIRTFRDLQAWQASMDLVVSVYSLTALLPPEERYGLSAQLRRASISVPSNVAEGHAFRTKPRAYRRHVRIALGSFAELETQLELVHRLYAIESTVVANLSETLPRTGQLLHGLLRALRSIKERRGDSPVE